MQARISSSRLPGKVLMDLGGMTCLEAVLHRLRGCGELDAVAVATSVDQSDDPLAQAVEHAGIRLLRGSLDDVLDRYRQAGEELVADALVRITGDCPLIEPAVVDRVVRRWRDGTEDYVANIVEPRTWPKGLDTEIATAEAIATAAAEATEPGDREHVTPWIRRRPQRFPQAGVFLDPPRDDVRITLDTEDDLRALRALIDRLGFDADLKAILSCA